MNIVLDTNVLISSFLFRGHASRLHVQILQGRFLVLLSPSILAEYNRVLAYPKFGLSESDQKWLIDEELLPFSRLCPEPEHGLWISQDPSDDCFVDLARSHPGSVLISGDQHILSARPNLPCPVLTVAELLRQTR